MTSWVSSALLEGRVESCGRCSEVDHVGRLLDTADAFSVDLGDSHVALLTPGRSPRVSHDPVLLVAVVSVSDDTDGVIESGTTSRVVEDTRSVGREYASVSFDEDRDRLLGDSSLHGTDVVGSDHLVR